jgi:hypothetical protein
MASDREDRYRRAAVDTLQQLDWCVRYLQRIRRPEIARAVARSRNRIMRRLQEADRADL